MTNYATAPVAAIADVVLCSTVQGSPLLGENAAARIAQLNIMDALFVAAAQRDLDSADANLARNRRAVEAKHRRWGPSHEQVRARRRGRRQPPL